MTNDVLKALLPAPNRLGKITAKEIQASTGLSTDQVTDAMAIIIRRGYAVRCSPGAFKVTPEGLEAIAGGKRIASGTTGPRPPRPSAPCGLRTRLWRALRHKRKGTIKQLLVLACRGDERDPQGDARKYLNALMRAGFVQRLPEREIREYRWIILRDSGPLAPQYNRHEPRVFDPNTMTTYNLEGAIVD